MNTRGLFQLYPLVPFTLCLILGIIVGLQSYSSVSVEVWMSAVVISLIICFALGKCPQLQTCSILAVSFLVGCALIGIAERNYKAVLPTGKINYEAVVASEPIERGKIIRFDMIVTSGSLSGRTVRAALLKDTVSRRYRTLCVGDGLKAYSKIQSPTNFKESNFDYVTYMKAHDIAAQTFIYYRDWQKASVSLSRLSILQCSRLSFMRLRHKLIEHYHDLGLRGEGFAITAAMTLGHRSDISSELRDIYSTAGVAHILALSGMHLSIIYMLLTFLFLGRRFGILHETLIVTAIWAYVFMVGMSPSIVRSAIMITVYSIVGLTGRDRMSLNVLAFAALLMLVANPFCLYDIGFQLSFISVAGILVLHRPIGGIVSPRFQQRHRLFRWLWNLVVMSCSAQLAAAPLVAYYFGNIPVYFLISNVVAVPAVTVILYLSVVMLVLFFIPVVQQYAVMLLMSVSTSLNTFLFLISSLPYSSVKDIHMSTFQLFAVYAVIISLVLICRIIRNKSDRHSY